MSKPTPLTPAAAEKEYKRLKTNMNSVIGKAIKSIKKSQEYRDSTAEQQEMMVMVIREETEENYYAQGKHPTQVPGYEIENPLNGAEYAATQQNAQTSQDGMERSTMPEADRSFTPVNVRRNSRTAVGAEEQSHMPAQDTERNDSNRDQAGGGIKVLPEGAGVHHQAAQGITLSVPIDYRGTITFAPGQ
ncbi:hypothetical protein BDZ85DRAFT_282622 [Elsinoe ampelina]|uniref:Uncharacterized protein n=1 Tax=Elsinoe ampelina TaxID=302913 RepID=A0A6A6GA14_9PEZI|nr:hypothetical protein BDZ85DRAFT_282622 [Elsinoe ampelina]